MRTAAALTASHIRPKRCLAKCPKKCPENRGINLPLSRFYRPRYHLPPLLETDRENGGPQGRFSERDSQGPPRPMTDPNTAAVLLEVDARRICVIKPSALGDVVQA